MNILTAIGVEGANSLLAIKTMYRRSGFCTVVIVRELSAFFQVLPKYLLCAAAKVCGTHLTWWLFCNLNYFQVIFKNFLSISRSIRPIQIKSRFVGLSDCRLNKVARLPFSTFSIDCYMHTSAFNSHMIESDDASFRYNYICVRSFFMPCNLTSCHCVSTWIFPLNKSNKWFVQRIFNEHLNRYKELTKC